MKVYGHSSRKRAGSHEDVMTFNIELTSKELCQVIDKLSEPLLTKPKTLEERLADIEKFVTSLPTEFFDRKS